MSKYAEIIERLEKATGADEALDADICILLQYGGENSDGAKNVRANEDWPGDILFEIDEEECCNKTPALTASIDAALALVERMLSGWPLIMGVGQTELTRPWARIGSWSGCDAVGSTLPIAILLALFRALGAKENDG